MPIAIATYKPKTVKQPRLNRSGLYDTQRWRKARKRFLKNNPLCTECSKEELVVLAEVVDHIEPHNGDEELFWNVNNWQGLCMRHHNVKSAKEKQSKLYG